VYYVEPSIVKCGDSSSVYGVGYSIHFLIKKAKKNLDVTKLPYLAACMQIENSKTQVFYSLQTHGISGIPLVKFFKPVVNKPFDVDGFGLMQSSIDGIHNVLSEEGLSKQIRFAPTELKFVKVSELEDL
jgi:hypothetical protein